jgi:hypothetical protein
VMERTAEQPRASGMPAESQPQVYYGVPPSSGFAYQPTTRDLDYSETRLAMRPLLISIQQRALSTQPAQPVR